MADSEYSFANDGIGSILSQALLKVPPNQRPYAWKQGHVRELLDDIREAMSEGDEDLYFLGTVVFVESGDDRKLIADGQQRIATASMILARCRDLLRSRGAEEDAQSVETQFLRKYIRKSKEFEFLVTMNVEDDEFFRTSVIEPDWHTSRPSSKVHTYPSNERLYEASHLIYLYLRQETDHLKDAVAIELLNGWVSFIEERASVVAVTVPDEVGAFRMFETLNDRGLRASQTDILKNYFFSKVKQSELDQIQAQWNQMYGVLADRFCDSDEQMLKYIKYYWTLENGLTRDRELAFNIKKKVRNGKQAITFVSNANIAVADYAAIFNASDTKWQAYGEAVRSDLSVLTSVFNIEQIVPLVFAIAHKLGIPEARKALRLCVVWSVRFLLGGSGRAGRLDKQYADLAHAVGSGQMTTARELREAMLDKVPTDDVFARAVRTAKVSNSVLARYYLLCLEMALSRGSGELEPSQNVDKVNLEHILPKTYTRDLGVTKADFDDLLTRLGNQTIMSSEWNRALGNMRFEDKKSVYAKSDISLTRDLDRYDRFTREEIDHRQEGMAALAPAVWTLKFGN